VTDAPRRSAPVRELRLLGRTRDGAALVLEADGERFVLRADETALAALGMTTDIAEEQVALSPRDIQDRIRHGESAVAIAATTSTPLASIERFAGPVLAEREHQARLAAATLIRDRTLGELVAAHTLANESVGRDEDRAAAEPSWDAWLEPARPGVTADGVWRVRVLWPSGRLATFAWRPATRALRALDGTARVVVDDAPTDLLEAVLRPIRGAGGQPSGIPAATGVFTQPRESRGRRSEVPSWEEIAASPRPPIG
jgi:hypothetical protein